MLLLTVSPTFKTVVKKSLSFSRGIEEGRIQCECLSFTEVIENWGSEYSQLTNVRMGRECVGAVGGGV